MAAAHPAQINGGLFLPCRDRCLLSDYVNLFCQEVIRVDQAMLTSDGTAHGKLGRGTYGHHGRNLAL